MAKETKIGLAFILLLLGAFGFVVYKKLDQRGDLLAQFNGEEEVISPSNKNIDEPVPTARRKDGKNDFGSSNRKTATATQYADTEERSLGIPQSEPTVSEFDNNRDFNSGGSNRQTNISSQQRNPARKDNFGDDFGDSGDADPFASETQRQQTDRFDSDDTRQFDRGNDDFRQSEPDEGEGDEGEGDDDRDFIASQNSAQQSDDGFGDDQPFDREAPNQQREMSQSDEFADASENRTASGNRTADAYGESSGRTDRQDFTDTRQSENDFGQTEQSADQADQRDRYGRPKAQNNFDDFNPDSESTEPTYRDLEPSETTQMQADSETIVSRGEPDPYGSGTSNRFGKTDDFGESTIDAEEKISAQSASPYGNSSRGDDRYADSSQPFDSSASEFADNRSDRLGIDAENSFQDVKADLYEVQPGDNYWRISKKQYGTARYYMALARFNQQRIPDPKRMRPGMKVLAPDRDVLEARYPDLFPKRTTSIASSGNFAGSSTNVQPPGFFRGQSGEPMYRIGSKDTLSRIAQQHLGRSSRWIQIYELNRSRLANPADLKIGTEIALPADASRVRLVQNPRRNR